MQAEFEALKSQASKQGLFEAAWNELEQDFEINCGKRQEESACECTRALAAEQCDDQLFEQTVQKIQVATEIPNGT